MIFHIVWERGVIDWAQAVLAKVDVGGNRGSIFEADAVGRIDVGVQRCSGVIPDTFGVNTGPVRKNDPVAGTEGVTVRAVGFTHIGTAKESGVGDVACRGVVVGQPPVAMQTGIINLLGIRLTTAGQAEDFALLLALGGVADVFRGAADGLSGEGPAVFQARAVIETSGAIEVLLYA